MRIVFKNKKLLVFALIFLGFCFLCHADIPDFNFGFSTLTGGGNVKQDGLKTSLITADLSVNMGYKVNSVVIGISPGYYLSADSSSKIFDENKEIATLNTFRASFDLSYVGDGFNTVAPTLSLGYDIGLQAIDLGISLRGFMNGFIMDLLRLSYTISPGYGANVLRITFNPIVLMAVVI